MLDVDALDFAKGNGLVTVVAQDARSGAVLMVAFADREAVERTIGSGELHLFSRARGPWHKGATSGNVLRVRTLLPDCDGDTLLAQVDPAGPACHTGARSCFGTGQASGSTNGDALGDALGDVPSDALAALDRTIAARMSAGNPSGRGYTQKLLGDRNLRLKKLGEEASELVTACADADPGRATAEAADLIYHTLVAVRAAGGSLDGIRAELDARAARTPSGESD